jgi:aminoglycoside/choline kinase family phosphotransferase
MNTENIITYLAEDLNVDTDGIELVPLHQHASYRSYVRAVLPNDQSYILMIIPEGKWSASEEVSNQGLAINELPFLNMSRYLTQRGFPIAEVISASEADGIIVLEDLGDQIFEEELKQKTLEEKVTLYQQAIGLIVDFQNKTAPDPECIAFARSFDRNLLTWEFNHFFEYGIEKRLGKTMSVEDKEFFTQQAAKICDKLLAMPQVLVHRDFQSRNLMIHQEQLWLIDFQDALMGPVTYDLVALLRDSYVVLDRRMRERLIDEYLEQSQSRYNKNYSRTDFIRWFDLTTIQRKLKDAGRFIFIDQEKGDPSFLPYISDSLQYVKEAFTRQAELKEFYERLKVYVPEWS